MGRRFFMYFVAIMFTSLLSEAHASLNTTNTDRVVAVVSGSVITKQELDHRFELTKRQINQAIPKNQLNAIYKKILNDLINEEVQRQYASEHNIVIEDSEIDLAISEIERRNNWTNGAFYTIANGIETSAKAKIKSDLIRRKIVDRRLRSRVNISRGEIDRLIENINNNQSTEKKIHQIFITVDKKEQEKDAQREIFKIYNQLKDIPDNFVTFSKNFSTNGSNFEKSMDDLGWFGQGELTPVLDKTLKTLNKNEMSQPILSSNGWHILYVEDIRTPEALSTEPIDEFSLFKFAVKIDDNKPLKTQKREFERMVDEFKTLGDIEEAVLRHQDETEYQTSQSLGWVKQRSLPQYLQSDIHKLDANDMSDIYEDDGYLVVYHLSDEREVLPEKLQEFRNRIYGRLMSNRLELAARRFMRDLRRQAYIEVRL